MRHPELDTNAHVDEGTIHAWLDDALPADERATVEAHVAACPACSAAAAEARGLVAGASRILAALDGGLGAVSAAPAGSAGTGVGRRAGSGHATRRWWTGGQLRAAAAVLIVAAGSGVVLSRSSTETRAFTQQVSDITATQDSTASFDSLAESVAPQANALEQPTVGSASAPAVAPSPAGARALRIAADREERDVPSASSAPSLTQPVELARRAAGLAAAPQAPPPPTVIPERVATAPAIASASAMAGRGSAADAAGGNAKVAARAMTMDSARRDAAADATVGVLRGQVRDAASGRPVEGATVAISGTGHGSVTDRDGQFTIPSVPAGTHVAVTRRIGYQSVERPVTVGGDPAELRLSLTPAANALTTQRIVAEAAPLMERNRAQPQARGLAAGTGMVLGAGDVAGCYQLGVASTDAGPWPPFVRLDTVANRDGRLAARLMTAGGRNGGWTDAAWSLSRASMVDVANAVTLSWRTSRARVELSLARDGRGLTGEARITDGSTDAVRRVGARLVRATCPAATP